MWQYVYPDELYHWKYIKREKVNGKWRYYYDEDLNNAYKSGTQKTTVEGYTKSNGENSVDQTRYNVTNRYKDSDSLFSTKERISQPGFNLRSEQKDGKTIDRYEKDVLVEHRRGKIERALADGERWIFEKFLKKRNR